MQTQKARPRPTTSQTEESSAPQRNDEEVTSLLADIDSVLEANAEEFVKAFKQKGGE
jgi:ubiquitin-like protein Pup